MKKIFILLMAATFAMLSACKKDKLATISSNIAAPVLSSPADGTAINVTVADSSQVLDIKWTSPDYGVSAVVNYFVEVATAGKNFSDKVNLANLTSKTSLSMSYLTFNDKLLSGLSLPPNATSNVEMRIGTAIYGRDTVYSAVAKLSVTTLAINQLWLPGSYQGYSPATAPTIPGTEANPNMYEGYAYFSAAGNFKFTSAPDYSHTNYGDGGGGKLTTDGNAGGIGYNDAGYYLLKADIANLTYSATYISTFGIIGTATPDGWDSSTPMTYSVSNNNWAVSVHLVPGALKFRANNAWDINYGPSSASALSGTLIFNDPGAVTVTDEGDYTVILDMSQRTQKAYLYSITKK